MPEKQTDISEPAQASNGAPNGPLPKEDTLETKGIFRVLAASSFAIGIGLIILGITTAVTMLALLDTQNPFQGIGAAIGAFLAFGIAGVGVLLLLGNVFAWLGAKIFKTRKAGIAILAAVLLYVGVSVFGFVGSLFSPVGDPVNHMAEQFADGCRPPECRLYPNGQKREERTESYIERDGRTIKLSVYESWHENGHLAEQTHYTNGANDGTSRTWYDNGQLRSEQNWSNSYLIGVSRQWTEAGIEITEE